MDEWMDGGWMDRWMNIWIDSPAFSESFYLVLWAKQNEGILLWEPCECLTTIVNDHSWEMCVQFPGSSALYCVVPTWNRVPFLQSSRLQRDPTESEGNPTGVLVPGTSLHIFKYWCLP
jgi:hypothetical protein